MDIKKRDDRYFTFTDPEGSVSFNLPGYISLVVEGYLHQLFNNPRNLEYTHLASVYRTIDRVRQDAECYTEGITNKEKFLKAIYDPRFVTKHDLKPEEQTVLKDYISKTKHSPPTVIQQLYMKGFSRIADDINFTDPLPELERTCEVFLQFIRDLKHVT